MLRWKNILLLLVPLATANNYLGGCKEYVGFDDLYSNMTCKNTCNLQGIGRDRRLKFTWILNTEFTLAALLTIGNQRLGWPSAENRYIGIIRLDQKFCGEELLIEIENWGKYIIDVGDKTNPNHWLESISFPHNIGEKGLKTALFIQFRRSDKMDGEMVSMNQKKDQDWCD